MFTDNRHPEEGIMSFILGCISVGTLAVAVLFTYNNGGQAKIQYAAASLFAALFSVVGLILGIKSRFEKDVFKIFPNLGFFLNLLSVIFVIVILFLGISGL